MKAKVEFAGPLDITDIEVNMLDPKNAPTFQGILVWPYDWVIPTTGLKFSENLWLVNLNSKEREVKIEDIRGWLPMPKWKAGEKGSPVAVFSIDKKN